MGFGIGEFVLLGVIIVIVFSASRMGQAGNALGKFVYSFKKASKGEDLVDVKPLSHGHPSKIVDAEIVKDSKR